MSWQQKFLTELMSPPSFDETQVQLLVGAVDFIAYNRVANSGEMHPNLMSASGARNRANDAEPIGQRRRSSEPPFNKKFRLCRCARNVNRLFEPDYRMLVFALTI
jgi:hypothetical protein